MLKESVFFSCLIILVTFETGYYLLNFSSNPNLVWSLEVGAVTSIIVAGLLTGIVAGFNFASSGENTFGARLVFIASTLFCLLFRFDIGTYSENGSNLNIISGVLSFITLSHTTPSIPIGIGLYYPNMTDIFLVNDMGILGMFGMFITTIIFFMFIVSGIMIISGDSG